MRNEVECVCSVCLFRCNIFIGVRIIKEMPGSVASGTLCSIGKYLHHAWGIQDGLNQGFSK